MLFPSRQAEAKFINDLRRVHVAEDVRLTIAEARDMTVGAALRLMAAMGLWAGCFPLITIGLGLVPHLAFAAMTLSVHHSVRPLKGNSSHIHKITSGQS